MITRIILSLLDIAMFLLFWVVSTQEVWVDTRKYLHTNTDVTMKVIIMEITESAYYYLRGWLYTVMPIEFYIYIYLQIRRILIYLSLRWRTHNNLIWLYNYKWKSLDLCICNDCFYTYVHLVHFIFLCSWSFKWKWMADDIILV